MNQTFARRRESAWTESPGPPFCYACPDWRWRASTDGAHQTHLKPVWLHTVFRCEEIRFPLSVWFVAWRGFFPWTLRAACWPALADKAAPISVSGFSVPLPFCLVIFAPFWFVDNRKLDASFIFPVWLVSVGFFFFPPRKNNWFPQFPHFKSLILYFHSVFTVIDIQTCLTIFSLYNL